MRVIVLVLAALLASALSAFSGYFGARCGGLSEGGWNWQFIPPFLYGFAGGLLTFMLILIVAPAFMRRSNRFEDRLIAALVGTPTLVFVIAFTWYYVADIPNKRSQAAYAAGQQRLKNDPNYIHELMHGARQGTLQSHEASNLWSAVFTRQSFTSEELAFLIQHYHNNGSALAGLIEYQALTDDQLRDIYTKHKGTPRQSPIVIEITDLKHPPIDILEDIAKDDVEGYANKAMSRLAAIKNAGR